MKRAILFFLSVMIILALFSCTSRKATIFQIGQTRESVINTIVDDFTIHGEKKSKEEVLDRENGNHITLYDCEYKGQYYRKVRVYYDNDKVREVELKTPVDKFPDLHSMLEDEYGTPHKTKIAKYYTKEDAVIYMGDECAVVVFEHLFDNEKEYEIFLISGEKLEKLNKLM